VSEGIQTLDNLFAFFRHHGVERVYVKSLAPNDNSKNQIYFGPGFDAISLFPFSEIQASADTRYATFSASLNFHWIGDDLSLVRAPTSKLVLYPQYPEVRFSGFLLGTDRSKLKSIRELATNRIQGRLLFLGINETSQIIGALFAPTSAVSTDSNHRWSELAEPRTVFKEITLLGTDSKILLLQELRRICQKEWINSYRLDAYGNQRECNASQCGGYTLEAELGIRPNGRSEPDFMGWEVKQHGGSVLTLLTPEPTGGFYKDSGVEAFIRKFGYPDRSGRADRINFGGIYRFGLAQKLTGLTLTLEGFDSENGKITDVDGGISLLTSDGIVAAKWDFSGMLKHWSRKHRNAVYVRSKSRNAPAKQYSFLKDVKLAEGTSPLHLLKAISAGKVYYDPGIKLENASSTNGTTKRRSQFRVTAKNLSDLYDSVTSIDVTKT